MLQAAYVTKNSFAASDSATKPQGERPANAPLEKNICQPCWDRKKVSRPAHKNVMGTRMCRACYSGVPEPSDEININDHGFEPVEKEDFPKRYSSYERRLNVYKALLYLDKQKVGAAVKVRLEEGDKPKYMQKYVHQVAERKYFHVETRIQDGLIYIRKGIDR